MEKYSYAVIGAGRQGTAAYDLARFGGVLQILLADSHMEQAQAAAARINNLAGEEIASAAQVDASDEQAVADLLRPCDVVVCAVPCAFIPACTRAVIASRTGMVDLGGHTPTVLAQLELCDQARAAGIAVVPDCGMGPGLNNSIGVYLI